MANNVPNLKVVVGADTSQFDKGMRTAKAQVRDFGKVTSDALGKVGDALGVNTAQIEKVSNAIGGLGQKMAQAGNEGAKAFGNLLSGVSKLNVGIVGLGLAGVVASFKALNTEAENFKSTIAGANIELQTKAYIETYKQAMHDVNAQTGRDIAQMQANAQKFWATAPGRAASRMAALGGGSATGYMFGSVQQLDLQQKIADNQAKAVATAERAEQIQGRLYELARQQSDATRQVADLDTEIANNKLIARDATYSTAERMQAVEKVTAAIQQKYAILLPIEQERTRLMDEMVGLTASTPAQVDAANQQYVRTVALEKQMADAQRELLEVTNMLRNASKGNNAELQKQLELQRKIAQSRADLASLDLSTSGSLGTPGASAMNTPGLVMPAIEQFRDLFYAQLGNSLFLQVRLDLDKQSFVDLTQEVQSLMANFAASVGDAIGGLIGDLATGGDAFGNFRSAALSAFADMATTVGKMAIATGVATLGIQAALESLNGWVAIAAGTALVALGAAVKAGLSNVAAGNYSASPGVASGSYSSNINSYETREVQVQVTGKLQADGDKLVAVLNNTDNRNGYTT